MKKIFVAFSALALAFAFSSCATTGSSCSKKACSTEKCCGKCGGGKAKCCGACQK